MNETVQPTVVTPSWATEKLLMGLSPREYVRTLVTPWNIAAALILLVGLPVIAYRFMYGLGRSRTSRRRTLGGSGSASTSCAALPSRLADTPSPAASTSSG